MSKSVTRRARGGEGKNPQKSHQKARRAACSAPTPAARLEGGFSPLGAGLELPAWRSLDDAVKPPPRPAETLLYALAGEPGGDAVSDPFEAALVRLATEVDAMAELLAPSVSASVADLMRQTSQRARALPELYGVSKLGSAA